MSPLGNQRSGFFTCEVFSRSASLISPLFHADRFHRRATCRRNHQLMNIHLPHFSPLHILVFKGFVLPINTFVATPFHDSSSILSLLQPGPWLSNVS